MKQAAIVYNDQYPEDFDIKHKVDDDEFQHHFHLHKQMEIVYACASNIKCQLERQTIDIPKNGIILINTMMLHYNCSKPFADTSERFVLYFSKEFLVGLSTPEINLFSCFTPQAEDIPVTIQTPMESVPDMMYLLKLMNKLCLLKKQAVDKPLVYSQLMMQLRLLLGTFLVQIHLLRLEQFSYDHAAAHNDDALVFEICDYISRNLDSPLLLERICGKFFISKTKLYHMYTDTIGISAKQYINRCRIIQAKNMLINSELPVEMIGQHVCYSYSAFIRAFREQTGITPLAYRKLYL